MRQTGLGLMGMGLALLLLASAGPALAQANTITYQGVLRDAGGNPVADGSYPMIFYIYDASTNGALLWNEGHAGVQVTDGAFSVQLGGTDQFGTLFQDHANTQLWLQVSVDTGSGQEAFSRVALAQMPYAAQATAADNAPTVPWGGLTGVPAGIADGDDVDGGVAATVPWAGVTGVPAAWTDGDDVDGGDAATLDGQNSTAFAQAGHTHPGTDVTSSVANADVAASVPWGGITGVPAGLLDGDDVDGGVAASVPWAGVTGVPADLADGDDVDGGAAASAPWSGVTGKPAGFADGTDNVDGGNADTVDGLHASAFAPTVHTHAASQIISGTFNLARLPVGTGAGQVAPGIHTHDASAITSGTIATARLNVGTSAGQVAAGDHTHTPSEYFVGALGAQTSGVKGIGQQAASNISLVNGNSLVVSVAGLYYVQAQQLSQSGPAFYFGLMLNGGTLVHAFNPGGAFRDLMVSRTVYLSAGDAISFQVYGAAQAAAWGYPHSSVTMYRVK